jgi:hypothetical protein
MNILPIDRALSLYGTLADRSETKGAREQLSRYLTKLYHHANGAKSKSSIPRETSGRLALAITTVGPMSVQPNDRTP